MKTDSVTMALLYDYYGELLTEKQKTCFDLYYNQDYSLAEIAENEGISRQGVHDSIVRAETMLRSCEDKIGCVARDQRVQEALADTLASQEQTWSTYLPDQYEKVQNNVTGRVGNLLYYITSDHPQELEEAIKK